MLVLQLPCGGGHIYEYWYTHVIKLNRSKYTHKHVSACKTGEILLKSRNGININFLILLLYYSYARCCHCGELDDGHMGLPILFLTTAFVLR